MKHPNLIRVFLTCGITLFFMHTFGQNLDSLLQNKRIHQAASINALPLPQIDGKLDDNIWNLGEWQGNFTQQQPYGNRPGSEPTYVKVLYDRSNLFVAIICVDSEPDKIRDFLDRRDALSGDMTGIAIDSYFDKRTAFEFNLSAGGQKMDLKHLGDYQWDMNWDAVWDGATSRVDSGWIAEMQIPFSQIRYADQAEHTWGMHVWRWIDRKKEEDQWQYIPLEAPAMVYLFGEMKGISDIRSSRQIEFLPYALSSYAPGANDLFRLNGGLDTKIGISSDYTLDLTVNPDFGQVEADPSVLNLSAFETFYQEKRPFFLEGNDVFDFELDGDIPYYSRRIGSAPGFPSSHNGLPVTNVPDRSTILSAAKFTGKSKEGLSVGVVSGLTAREFGETTDSMGVEGRQEVAPLSSYAAARIKKEFQEGNSNLGAFISSVNRITNDPANIAFLPSDAYTGGIDILHQWDNRNYYIEAKTIASYLKGSQEAILLKQLSHNHRFQRPDADHLHVDSTLEVLSGNGSLLRIGKKGGKWNFSAQGQYRSPGLNLNDMGYIRQSDFIADRLELSYDMNEPTKHIRDYSIEIYQEARWSFGGQKNMQMIGTDFSISNLKLWSLSLNFRYDFSHLDPTELRGGPALRNNPFYLLGASLYSNSSKDLYGRLGYYYNGASVESFSSNSLYTSLTWLPVRRVKLSGIVHLNKDEYYQHYIEKKESGPELKTIVSNIERSTASFTFRGEFFFTPEMSLQYYGNPYFSVGRFDDFRFIADAANHDLEERFTDMNDTYDQETDSYYYELDGETQSLENPNFSFMQYRSNIVFRWEYNPGSTVYLVWSHDRSDWSRGFNPISEITRDILDLQGSNIFMMKVNFWFGL